MVKDHQAKEQLNILALDVIKEIHNMLPNVDIPFQEKIFLVLFELSLNNLSINSQDDFFYYLLD